MGLITDIEEYLRMRTHDSTNTLECIKCWAEGRETDKFELITRYIQHQKQIDSALLSLADWGNVNLQLKNQNLYSDIVELAIIRHDMYIRHFDFEFDVPKNLTVYTETDLCYRYFFNILSNAMHVENNELFYNKEKGKIAVKAYEEKDKVVLSVSDNGVGIKDTSIITKWGGSTKEGGGFGLAFLDIVAPKINMDYRIDTELGKGTTFYLSFKKK